MRSAASVAILVILSFSVGCEEPVIDADRMCIEPSNCPPCESAYECEFHCATGDFPSNTPFRVVLIIEELDSIVDSEECSAIQSGDFELTLHSTWRREHRRNVPAVTDLITVECGDTPALAPGFWTLKYGEKTELMEIPGPGGEGLCLDAAE